MSCNFRGFTVSATERSLPPRPAPRNLEARRPTHAGMFSPSVSTAAHAFAEVLDLAAAFIEHMGDRSPDPAWLAIAVEFYALAARMREIAATGMAWPHEALPSDGLVN